MNIWLIAIVAVIVIILFLIAEAWLEGKGRKRGYEYRKRACVMTHSEKMCFDALVSAVGSKYDIFPQIHLPSILDHKIVGQNWYGAFRHIDEKSVDFVLCDKASLSPVLAIELDDRSHERPDRKERDREVERILKDANLPLLRIKDSGSLVQKIEATLRPLTPVAIASVRTTALSS